MNTPHSSFADISNVRKALETFLEQEHSTDSRYALMAIGRQIRVVQHSTPDSGFILNALHRKELQKSILQSETSNLAIETNRFMHLVTQYPQALTSLPTYGTFYSSGKFAANWGKLEVES